MDRGRTEALSDGVLAVTITLLVLDLHVGDSGEGSQAGQLRHNWPDFAAYLVSFFVIVHHDLLADPVGPAVVRRAVRRFGLGTVAYPVATVAGLLWPPTR